MTDYVFPKKPELDNGLKEDRGWSRESHEQYMYRRSKEGVTKVTNKQVGGDHYKDVVISSIEYITKNKLDFCEGNIIKYISRHRKKGGAEDIKKAIHYAELILELEYGTED